MNRHWRSRESVDRGLAAERRRAQILTALPFFFGVAVIILLCIAIGGK